MKLEPAHFTAAREGRITDLSDLGPDDLIRCPTDCTNRGGSVLHWAAGGRNVQAVAALIDRVGRPLIEIRDTMGKTLLHWAAETGSQEMVTSPHNR